MKNLLPKALLLTSIAYAGMACAVVHTPGSASVDRVGNAQYQVPIVVPPGTAGMAPSLSLGYSSSNGGGMSGVGFGVSGLSSIERCTPTIATDNMLDRVRLEMTDKFCMDGQRLVVINSGTYGADQSQYRTEVESFSKVVANGTAGSGPAWFKVWTKSGLIMEYGNTTDSRIESQSGQTARSWLLNKVEDRSGNYYTITYNENTTTGEALVSRIDYTGNVGAGLSPYNSVRFVYENRPDITSYYAGPALVTNSKRLTAVQTYNEATLVREYRLTYDLSPGTGRSRVTTVAECDATGNCLLPTTFAWNNGGGGLAQAGATATAVGSPTAFASPVLDIKKGDFNLDGFEDVWVQMQDGAKLCYGPNFDDNWQKPCQTKIVPAGTQIFAADFNGRSGMDIMVKLPNGDLRLCSAGISAGYPHDVANCELIVQFFNAWQPYVGDFTGDGRADIYLKNGASSYFIDRSPTGQGSGYVANLPLAGHVPVIGDFDGDGRDDIIFYSTTTTLFCSGVAIASASGQCQTISGASGWKDVFNVVMGDINADGIKDIVLIGAAGAHICPGPGITSANNCSLMTGTDWKTGQRPLIGDINGDGLEDLVLIGASGTRFCPAPGLLTGDACTMVSTSDWSGAAAVAADGNGNGVKDLFLVQGQQGYLASGGAGAADLLAAVTNGLGATSTFAWLPLTDSAVYNPSMNSPDWTAYILVKPLHVVRNFCQADGIGNNRCTENFYSKAKFSLVGRGFLGFDFTRSADLATGRTTQEYRSQSFPTIGTLLSTITSQGGAQRVETRTFQTINVLSGRTAPVMTERVVSSGGLDGEFLAHRYLYTYDATGSLTRELLSVDEVNDPWRQDTQIAYGHDVVNWLLNRESSRSVTRSMVDGSLASIHQTLSKSFVANSNLVSAEYSMYGQSAIQVVRSYTYNPFGNVLTSTVTGHGMSGRTTTMTYDAKGRLPLTVTNPLNQTSSSTYDMRFGTALTATDPNNLTVTWTYDDFGRRLTEARPDGTQTTFAFAACAACVTTASNAPVAYWISQQSTGASQPTVEWFDIWGRSVVKSVRNFADSEWLDSGAVMYDTHGRAVRKYLPHFRSDSNKPYSALTYTPFNTLASETAPDGAVTTLSTSFDAPANRILRTVTDARGNATSTRATWRGLVTSATDALSQTVTYTHDVLGNQTSMTDHANNTIAFQYDSVGRRTATTDPNMGTTTVVYNALNEVLSQTDGANQTTTFTYDALGRKLTQSVAGMTSNWSYDAGNKGVGKLASVASGNGVSRSLVYDNVGRLSSHTQVIDSLSYTEQFAYDAAGRIDTLTYPTGFAIKHVYNALGYRSEVRQASNNALIWRADAVSAAGVTDETYGNGTGVTRDYLSSSYRENRISHVRDSDNALLQRWEYTYDLAGNTTQRVEAFGSVTEAFTYDPLNRLTQANASSPGAPQTNKLFSMDGVGNMQQKTDVFDTPERTGTYSYQGTGPHAVTSITKLYSNPTVLKYFGHTNAGAATGWDGLNINNTAFNLPYSVSKPGGGIHYFTYDEAYQRVKYATPTNARVYFRSALGPTLYERDQPTGGATRHRLFIFGAGRQPVAQVTIVDATTQWHYLHHDRLGSITLITDQNAQTVERHYFDAYGKRRNVNGTDAPTGGLTSAVTSRGFTGHEHLDELNLIHMNGRIYDPYVGRFLSGDPVLHETNLAQGMNRFSYAFGNPLLFVDPSGFTPLDDYYARRQVRCQNCGPGDGGDRIEVTAPRYRWLERMFDALSDANRADLINALMGNRGSRTTERAGGRTPSTSNQNQVQRPPANSPTGSDSPPVSWIRADGSVDQDAMMAAMMGHPHYSESMSEGDKAVLQWNMFLAAAPVLVAAGWEAVAGTLIRDGVAMLGRTFSEHALSQMATRGIPPSAVREAILNGTTTAGNSWWRLQHTISSGSAPGHMGYYVITERFTGRVITVVGRGSTR